MKASVASMWPVGVDRTALHGRYRKMPREPRLLDKIQASESPLLETQGGQLPRNDTLGLASGPLIHAYMQFSGFKSFNLLRSKQARVTGPHVSLQSGTFQPPFFMFIIHPALTS